MTSTVDYTILRPNDGAWRLSCFRCGTQTEDVDDVYLRHCPKCQFLGPEIRQRWNGGEGRRTLLALCATYGRYKRVRCPDRKTWHAVPLERIATEGISGYDVHRFPRWTDEYTKTVPTDLPFANVEIMSMDSVVKIIITPKS